MTKVRVTPGMLAAAWAAWRVRHPHLRLGPGPAFREAIEAALAHPDAEKSQNHQEQTDATR